jgi:predicted acyltransferase
MNKPKRLMSLDALRGFDMLFIMGLSSLIVAICELFPGGADCAVAQQMSHVSWHGLRHHDTIFPLFLFVAGISFPFSYANQLAKGMSRKDIYIKIFKRGFTLFFLGLVYNGLFKFDFENLRVASVLGRIGFAWMFAALLFINCNVKQRSIIAAVVLVGYWLLLRFVSAPDVPGADPFSFEDNLVGYIDRLFLPGRILSKTFDPEGILSTLPAIVTAMLGMMTGEFVKQPDSKFSGNKKSLYMFLAAVAMLVVGFVWSTVFPINKKLWTSTFVLVVGAYSLGMFALFYYIIDVKGYQKWTLFFRVVGLNSITIYLAQRIFSFSSINNFFFGGIAKLLPDAIGHVVLDGGYLFVSWLFLYFLYKKNVFLKV